MHLGGESLKTSESRSTRKHKLRVASKEPKNGVAITMTHVCCLHLYYKKTDFSTCLEEELHAGMDACNERNKLGRLTCAVFSSSLFSARTCWRQQTHIKTCIGKGRSGNTRLDFDVCYNLTLRAPLKQSLQYEDEDCVVEIICMFHKVVIAV
jgi:hypothetical protein